MKLFLHNSLTRTTEEFIPLMQDPKYKGEEKKAVCIYSCGPTVYGDPHIGNMRAFTFADILKCTIKYFLELPVQHTMNITDVGHLTNDSDNGEDKMERQAKKDNTSARDIAAMYGKNFMQYMEMMHNEEPNDYTWATKYIKEQIQIVKMLMEKGLTYEIPGDGIYMDTAKIGDYGKMLPPGHLEGLKDGARIDDHGKKSKTDFALWKFSPHDQQRQMEWIFDGEREAVVIDENMRETLTSEEQNTRGFPGWHVECSAMAWATLGDNIDIHTGGMDHIPVHHTNEIAQSECSFCQHKPRSKYWLHNQFLNIKGEKISKSLGNVFTMPDILEKGFTALDLRFFFFTAQYNSFQDFTWDNLVKAKNTRKNLQKKLSLYHDKQIPSTWSEVKTSLTTQSGRDFALVVENALGDNLHTPKLLAAINSALAQQNDDIVSIIRFVDNHLLKCDLFVQKNKIQDIPQTIIDLAEARLQAKSDKDYNRADTLRNEIYDAGYEIHDTKDGYSLEQL